MNIRNRIYYLLKPVLPVRIRLAMRRWRGRRILEEWADRWPIYESSGTPPEGWPGWPGGKEFAFILTHDVESQEGLDRCQKLAEIEMEYGFRSVFNFIPRSGYTPSAGLLDWLRGNGFEIGIHDLHHDGNLFKSATSFEKNATQINRQIKEWGAKGFRAGFMLHQLEWLHALNIQYDSSTFDVDPFEAQPDGVQTVFPFWVKKPDPKADAFQQPGLPVSAHHATNPVSDGLPKDSFAGGYVELPYTLVQDFNLFVVLREKGIGVWRRKLQWLADKGAMALLNTHPDYMVMDNEGPRAGRFPVALYREFLDHVRLDYGERYWHALPCQVSEWCRTFVPPQARPPRRIVMLTYSYYKYDNRVRRYSEALVRRGDQVRVFCLGSEEQVKSGEWEMLNGVQIRYLQTRPTAEKGKLQHASRLLRFFLKAFNQLNPRKLPGGCDLLHVHNIPDFLVFAGARLKVNGVPVILDIHDIVPELYESKFTTGQRSIIAWGLKIVEKLACHFADHVIIANHIWKETILGRSAPLSKVTALVNNVDLNIFSKRARTRRDDRLILLYPGTLNQHQGIDIALNAVSLLAGKYPQLQLHIYGGGPALEGLKEQARDLRLAEQVQFFPGVFLDEVPGLIANADIGIVPKRAEGFGDQAYSTKIMEFMSQGLPVVLSRTRIDSFYFDTSDVAFFHSGDAQDMARAIREVIEDSEYRGRLSRAGLAYAQANSWETMKQVYFDLVDRLTMTGIPAREMPQTLSGAVSVRQPIPDIATPAAVLTSLPLADPTSTNPAPSSP